MPLANSMWKHKQAAEKYQLLIPTSLPFLFLSVSLSLWLCRQEASGDSAAGATDAQADEAGLQCEIRLAAPAAPAALCLGTKTRAKQGKEARPANNARQAVGFGWL